MISKRVQMLPGPFSLFTEPGKGTLATVVTVMIIKYAPHIKYGHF